MCDVVCATDNCVYNDNEDGCKLDRVEIGCMGCCLNYEAKAGDKSETL